MPSATSSGQSPPCALRAASGPPLLNTRRFVPCRRPPCAAQIRPPLPPHVTEAVQHHRCRSNAAALRVTPSHQPRVAAVPHHRSPLPPLLTHCRVLSQNPSLLLPKKRKTQFPLSLALIFSLTADGLNL